MNARAIGCSPRSWYRVDANCGEWAGYAVLEMVPRDARGGAIAPAVHLPVRPGRAASRVVYAPRGCVALSMYWLFPENGIKAVGSEAIRLQKIAPWRAIWQMFRRQSRFVGQASWANSVFVIIASLLSARSLYQRYENAFHHLPRTRVSLRPASSRSGANWPLLRELAWADLLTMRHVDVGDSQWVVVCEPEDRWLAGGIDALKNWQKRHPKAGVIVFDELRRGEQAGTKEPWFKPEWNPDLYYSSAYTGHGVAIRGDLFIRFFGEVANDEWASADELVDAVLVAMLKEYARDFEHLITRCPYLAIEVVADSNAGRFCGQWSSRRRTRLQSLLGTGLCSVESGRLPASWQVSWPLPEPPPLVSLCIPTRNALAVLKPCLESILGGTEYTNIEVLVVDNQSDCPETLNYLAEFPQLDARVRVLRYNAPFNFAAINNYAVAHANGELIGLINNDVSPRHAGWLGEMVRQALRPEIGCVGAKLYYPNGTIQHAGVVLGVGGVAGHAFRFEPGDSAGYQGRLEVVQNYSAVTAACLVVRKSTFLEAGGMDEQLAVNYNDVDFCLKVRSLGYRNLWTPYAELTHHESATRGGTSTPEKTARAERERRLMHQKWGDLLMTDPAYHPALTHVHEDFSLSVEAQKL